MSRVLRAVTTAACFAASSSLQVGPAAPLRRSGFAASAEASCRVPQPAPMRLPARVAAVQMSLTDRDTSFYDEYVETDPVTGEKKTLTLDAKEKLYLECLDAYYNENGKQLLSDEEYQQLKLDLDFDGSKVAVFSKDEIRFVLANKRFRMGKAILTDPEYDALREKLKQAGSLVVLHDTASCTIDGICKTDLSVDAGKTRLLYLPGTSLGLILLCEAFFWTIHIDPILSIILGAVPSYFFGIWFTENVFAQNPVITNAPCPEADCAYINTVFFGDLFAVQTDGIVPGGAPGDKVDLKCPNCKVDLEARRDEMILITTKPKGQKKAPAKAK